MSTKTMSTITNNTLILKGLPYNDTRVYELLEIFENHGEIDFVKLLQNSDKSCKGIGFVRFTNHEGSEKAVKSLPDFWYNGRKVFVEYAKPRE